MLVRPGMMRATTPTAISSPTGPAPLGCSQTRAEALAMSKMSTGTRIQAPVRRTRSAAKPPAAASAKPARARVTPSDAPCRPAPGLAREVATTTITRAPKPMGSIWRSSASRLARACRRADSVYRDEPAAGGAEDGAADGRT